MKPGVSFCEVGKMDFIAYFWLPIQRLVSMKQTAILLLHCPDRKGIISEVTRFITDNGGNIVYLDQYVDQVDSMFFMRIEWELDGFRIPR